MAIDGVAWAIGSPAQHSPELARLVADIAGGGSEGVNRPEHFKVSALTTPGASVNVAPGGAVIMSRANGAMAESYAVRAPTTTNVPVAANNTASARYDLVIARIEDPYVPGSTFPVPATPASGPYWNFRVISGVASTVVSAQDTGAQSSIALALITMPANTGVVSAPNIKDLRQLVAPKFESHLISGVPTVYNQLANTAALGGAATEWPTYAPTVKIPTWANWVSMTATWSGVGVTGDFDGAARTRLGSVSAPPEYIIDFNGGTGQRLNIILSCSGDIPASDRGREVRLVTEARKAVGTPGAIGTNLGFQMIYHVNFYQRLV